MARSPITTDTVRTIVAEVLRRVRAEASQAALQRTAAPVHAPVHSPVLAGVALADRVLTLGMLERLPPGTRRVTVPATAVVTPSARDHARDQGISIVRGSTTPSAAGRPFIVAHADCPTPVAPQCAAIARAVPAAQQVPPSGLSDVLQALAIHAARDGARGVLLTGRPAIAAVLANRSPSLRAVIVTAGVATTARAATRLLNAAAECCANLLIVNPEDFSAGGLERLCGEFAACDLGAVPAALTAASAATSACGCKGPGH